MRVPKLTLCSDTMDIDNPIHIDDAMDIDK